MKFNCGSGGGEVVEQRPHNLEVSSLNQPGTGAFFSSPIDGRVSLIRSLKRDASLLFFL